MGTLSISIKSAALCGALLVPLSAAHAQGIGASAGVGGAPGATVATGTAATAAPRSTIGAVRSPAPGLSTTQTSATQATTTQAMPGLMQNGAGANLALSGPGTAPSAATSGGLTPSDQSLLMNFGSAGVPAPAGASNVPTPAQQMHAQIQAEQQSAITSNSAVGPVPQTVPGSTIGTAASPNTGGLNSTITGGLTSAPVVSPPVANNPGTLAETAQSAAQ